MTQTHSSIRILLVDDHTILREGLKQLLTSDPAITVCGEAEDGDQAVVQALTLKPDIILMDVNLTQVNGYEASRAILTTWPEARIVVLTNQDDAQILKQFLDLGVKGFLLKDVQLETLLQSLHQVMAGEPMALSPHLRGRLDRAQKNTDSSDSSCSLAQQPGTYGDLTQREQEVLQALAKGYSNRQLADLLVVSPKTVHNHLYNIYSKIGVASRAEAIVWALESGFAGES